MAHPRVIPVIGLFRRAVLVKIIRIYTKTLYRDMEIHPSVKDLQSTTRLAAFFWWKIQIFIYIKTLRSGKTLYGLVRCKNLPDRLSCKKYKLSRRLEMHMCNIAVGKFFANFQLCTMFWNHQLVPKSPGAEFICVPMFWLTQVRTCLWDWYPNIGSKYLQYLSASLFWIYSLFVPRAWKVRRGASSNLIVWLSVRLSVIPSCLQSTILQVWVVIQ